MSSPPKSRTPARKYESTPCRHHIQGHCQYGDKCRYSHDANVQDITYSGPPSSDTKGASNVRAKRKPKESPHRELIASHDADEPGCKSHKRENSATPRTVPLIEVAHTSSTVNSPPPKRTSPQKAVRKRPNATREVARTITQIVFGSVVTYTAGLDIQNLITGFETCTLRIGSLPLDTKEGDIRTLLRKRGWKPDQFHVMIHEREARIVTDITTGRALESDLDGTDFQEESLVVEISTDSTLEGMNAATGITPEVLAISWSPPSVRYIAEYVDAETANTMAKKLDCFNFKDRRIKVGVQGNAIKINNLPSSVTDEDVVGFTESRAVRKLGISNNKDIAKLVRNDIERAFPGGLKKFDPPGTCNSAGFVSAHAHFSSWEEAHTAYTFLSEDKRYHSAPRVHFRFAHPIYFKLEIPTEQYNAQKTQWNSLSNLIKDKKVCILSVRDCDSGKNVRIRLFGSIKETTGALKVRAENLARGDKVQGWHRSFGDPGNPFVSRVCSETGAYLRADCNHHSLRVYGAPRAVDKARKMIKNELVKLSSSDYTVVVERHSVGFFVREGVAQLKETLGENNVGFSASSRKITVPGGEEARHALDRLIPRSCQGNLGLSDTSEGSQTCPICYDNVTSSHRLDCGHVYCVACLRHFISSAFESDQLPLTCLGDEAQCRVLIAISTIQQFIPPASFNRLLEVAFDAFIVKHAKEFKHCKTPDCPQIYRAVRAGEAPQTLHCPACFSAVCNACHEDGHDGLSCAKSKARRDPAEQERLTDAWITSQNGRVKKCPQCGLRIEKLEGCNHLVCRCGAHVCWCCMGIFTAETIYNHMGSVHGSWGDAQACPEPQGNVGNVGEQREIPQQTVARRRLASREEEEVGCRGCVIM